MDFHFTQSRLIFTSDNIARALAVFGVVVPAISVAILVWKRKSWRSGDARWRWRVWQTGLALVALAALALPLFLLALEFLSDVAKRTWFPAAGTRMLFFAFVMTPIAIILLGFGRGKQRWLGMLSAALSFIVLYVSLLALSY